MALIERIISGGQTGADRAALDFAIENGIPHGGWCPSGRNAEDGVIDARYQLQETASGGYAQRTEWNVRDSDGTAVFSIAPTLEGGSKTTAFLAHKLGKPVLRISRDGGPASPQEALLRFIQDNRIKVLNVAGPRASEEPEVATSVKNVLGKALGQMRHPAPGKTVRVVMGNREMVVNLMYQFVLRLAHPEISFHFEVTDRVGDFIRLACRPETNLAMFTPPGNLTPEPGSPAATPEEEAVSIVRAIKSERPLPVIVIAVQYDARQALIAAGADVFLELPAQAQQVLDAVAKCLGLEQKKIVSQ